MNHGPADWPRACFKTVFDGEIASWDADARRAKQANLLDSSMQADVKSDGYSPNRRSFGRALDLWGSKIVLLKDESARRWILRSDGPSRQDDQNQEEDLSGTWRGHLHNQSKVTVPS